MDMTPEQTVRVIRQLKAERALMETYLNNSVLSKNDSEADHWTKELEANAEMVRGLGAEVDE